MWTVGYGNLNDFQTKSQAHNQVNSGQTCYDVWTSAKISEQAFRDMNPEVNCGSLQVNSPESPPPLR